MESDGKPRPVFVDFEALYESREQALGRPLTDVEKEVLGMPTLYE